MNNKEASVALLPLAGLLLQRVMQPKRCTNFKFESTVDYLLPSTHQNGNRIADMTLHYTLTFSMLSCCTETASFHGATQTDICYMGEIRLAPSTAASSNQGLVSKLNHIGNSVLLDL